MRPVKSISVAGAALLPCAALLISAPLLFAQGVPIRIRRPPGPPSQSQPAAAAPAAANSAATTPAAAANPGAQPGGSAASPQPASLLQEPAKPAAIRFGAGSLAIDADNSSLSAILREISKESGMTIDGLNGDERVFGSFGPGKPFDVLSDLLNGTQYNVMMVGSLTNGAPRRLSLLPLHGDATAAASAPAAGDSQSGDADAVDTGLQAVRTPQQMFEQLQAMRQQQLQRQQPQPQQPQPPPQQQAWQHPAGN